MLVPARQAFTLIELLIVVAIIAILAAIAVPNFLEAQTRAKVSRVKGDFSCLATALESYCVDNSRYPPQAEGGENRLLLLTSPVAYLTVGRLEDPFTFAGLRDDDKDKYYRYRNIVELVEDGSAGHPPAAAVYKWGVFSAGPDKKFIGGKQLFGDNGLLLPETFYDPTNGSVSPGDILRTHRGLNVR